MPSTLEPTLTAFDQRVLDALRPPDEWLSAWQVAELIREDKVADVRQTLRGLTHLGYAISTGWDYRQRWAATWRRG